MSKEIVSIIQINVFSIEQLAYDFRNQDLQSPQ